MTAKHYRYTIDVDELGYAELMRMVMRYGSGASPEGMSTAVTTRLALANAEIRIAEEHVGETAPITDPQISIDQAR